VPLAAQWQFGGHMMGQVITKSRALKLLKKLKIFDQ